MPTYMRIPQNQLTLGSTIFSNRIISAVITRLENGFDTATIEIPDEKSILYPSIVTTGTALQFDVKDNSDTAYTTISKGIVRFPITPYGNNEIVELKCDGTGYGFSDTVCAQEYGSQSRNPALDTIAEILTDASYGIVPKYVNKILGSATDSGFGYTTTTVDAITGVIPYIYYPYKPNNKAIDDLCDLLTAIKAEATEAGPHWIVTTDDKLHVKQISSTQASWTKYYGDSQSNATLTQGIDFSDFKLETIGPEANYIIYNGSWRRPSNGDYAENNHANWGTDTATVTYSDDNAVKIVGDYSIKFVNSVLGGSTFTYPNSKDAAWDFSMFSPYNTPTLNYYLLTSEIMAAGGGFPYTIRFCTAATDMYRFAPGDGVISIFDKFQRFSYPFGPYAGLGEYSISYEKVNNADWANINYIEIEVPLQHAGYANIDGFYMGDTQITRIAKNSTNITANKVKMKVITDNMGKDDTLTSGTLGTTDTGLMARLAYAELLRLQKNAIVGVITIPMLKDALPGQQFHIHAKKKIDGVSYNIDKDMRATKITHTISSAGYFSTISLTDDLTNAHARSTYEDRNKIMAAARPDYQDRQASSIKAGDIDIRVTPLEEDYPS
jgi:hypothetical protein